MVRRIAALLLLETRLDRNYEAISRIFYPWPQQTTTKNSHHIMPDPDGGWNVRKGGAARASKHFDTKKGAISWGREVSNKEHSDLVIHNRDGTIERKDSYGSNPLPSRD